MKCPRCGNEVQPEEVFCGQCGAPRTPPAPPTEMVNSTPHQTRGLPGPSAASTPPFAPSSPGMPNPRTQVPPRSATNGLPPPNSSFIAASQSLGTANPNQHTGFYHDATEMIPLPNSGQQGPSAGYPQQHPAPPGSGSLPGQYSAQTPAFGEPYYGQQGPQYARPSFAGNSNPNAMYGRPIPPALPPQEQRGNPAVVIICILLVVALISAVGVTTLYLTRNHAAPTASGGNNPAPTQAPAATAAPTSAPTDTPTAEPTAAPTPVATPLPPPDAGFLWCGPECSSFGFSEEYPNGWQLGGAATGNGIQFANTNQPDMAMTCKAIGTATTNASTYLSNEIQTVYASKPGYVAPTGTTTATISGENWVAALLYFQGETQQKERVVVFATVHQGKSYIIELQAPDAQFDQVNTTYYQPMLSKFQFLPQTTP